MLEVRSLHVAIESVVALRGLSLEVGSGRMVGLVGRNGAGKTTLMRTLMGHLAPTQRQRRLRRPRPARAAGARARRRSASATCRKTAAWCPS